MDTYTAEEFAHTASWRGIARKADALKWCKLNNRTELVCACDNCAHNGREDD